MDELTQHGWATLTRREIRERLGRHLDIAAELHRQGGGRQALQIAFATMYEYVRRSVPANTDLSALAYLGAALHDLDDGLHRPELKPARTARTQFFEKRRSIGYAAAAVEAFMEDGESEVDANRRVAVAIDTFWPARKVTATTVDNWRSSVSSDERTSPAACGYREAREAWLEWRSRFEADGLSPYKATEFLDEYCKVMWRRLLSHLQPDAKS